MRSHPGSFHLSFLLPKEITFRPAIDGAYAATDCYFRITHPLVKICGPSRQRVFGAATGFLRSLARPSEPVSISATLASPPNRWPGHSHQHDGWSIILGADVAFAPTALGATFPEGADAGMV